MQQSIVTQLWHPSRKKLKARNWHIFTCWVTEPQNTTTNQTSCSMEKLNIHTLFKARDSDKNHSFKH